MERIESFLAKICVIVLSILVALIAVEVGANYYLWNIASVEEFNLLASINQIKARYGDNFFSREDDGTVRRFSPHHYLGYYPTPNLSVGDNRHNALGFRGDPVKTDKDENTYRIVALGGSTTYCTGVKDYRHTYPKLLGEYLQDKGFEQVEVINAGVNGYASYQNLMNLQFRVLPLQPDLVIIYQGLNDVDARFVYPHDEYLGDNSGYTAPYVSDTRMPPIWEYSTVLRILGVRAGITRPHADVSLHQRLPAVSNRREPFLQQWLSGTYPSGLFSDVPAMEILKNNPPIHFERNLQSMLAMADRHDVDVLLVTFVTTAIIRHPMSSSAEYIFALGQHNDLTRSIATSTGTSLFDIQAVFPDAPSLFTDGRHMNVKGNRVRAQHIGDFVISEFLS